MGDEGPILKRKIKGYQITGLLGRGGMGAVYRAEHPLIGKQIAIKLLQGEGAKDEQAVARFLQEAKSVNDIHHENVVDIIDFDQTPEGEHFILMEFLDGGTLTSQLKDAPFTPERMGHIGLQICSALESAHQKNIIHRDLKSDNIYLISRSGVSDFVKILDFGIAKLLAKSEVMNTGKDVFLGSPTCMAPEQALGTELSARTDIYGLGVILYQMATGVVPFHDENPLVLVTKHLLNAPVSPRLKNPALSEEMDTLIQRCLQKKPDDRYPSMAALAEALGAATNLDVASYIRKSSANPLASSPRLPSAPSYADLSFRASNTGRFAAAAIDATKRRQEDLRSTTDSAQAISWQETLREESLVETLDLETNVEAFENIEKARVQASNTKPKLSREELTAVLDGPRKHSSDTLPKGERRALPLPGKNKKALLIAAPLLLVVLASLIYLLIPTTPPPAPLPASLPKTEPASLVVEIKPAPGFFSLTSKPVAECFIDGKSLGMTPLENIELPPGTYNVELKTKKKSILFEPFSIEIVSGQLTELKKEPKKATLAPTKKNDDDKPVPIK